MRIHIIHRKMIIPHCLLIALFLSLLSTSGLVHAAGPVSGLPNGNGHSGHTGQKHFQVQTPTQGNATTNPNNAAVQYAEGHWDWNWQSTESTANPLHVQQGDLQGNFQCAEFVARALTAEGFFSELNADTSTSDQYANYSGYNLRLVGDLYTYITNNGLGTDIGNNPQEAVPGDVVFYTTPTSGMFHTVLLTATGTTINGADTLMDGHNVAEHSQPYSPGWDEYGNQASITIVHMNVTPPSTSKQQVYTYIGHTTDNRLEVYARGSNNNIWHRYRLAGGGWSNWGELQPGGQFNGNPAVGINKNGTKYQIQEIFARGNDNNIWHIWQTSPDGDWISAWQPLQAGFSFQGTPAVGYTAKGYLEVYARGSDNNIWHNYQNANGSWSGWGPLESGGQFNGDPVVGNYADGHQEVFARGNDNNIWHIWQTAPDGDWIASWQPLAKGYTFLGTPAIGFTADKQIEIYARGVDNNIYHNWQYNGNWNGWTPLQAGGQFVGDPAVVTNNNGAQDVFAVGSNHDMWHIWKTAPDGGWVNGWQDLQANYPFEGTPAAQLDTGGSEEVFAIDNGTHAIWHNWQDPSYQWSGWNKFTDQQGFTQ
ncbi:hypothetical protein KDA_68380 [Dictyobacter alpinus]|uniref:PLL-like beta propeller domain-containing protein n=1 Tax=Dictyobacter alpinus TaxID=2014873 RepID=A0A402BIY2_9CHLR|nr:hypothetical protein [Dictyobacter alpinus]GCE31354.1 hypothetical protein KDA_68380 [Dictyobacter alpinus]